MAEIKCENLSKRFGRHSAVSDFSVSIAENELVGIVGPSGSGKTTLLRMMAGLEAPDTGLITLGSAVANNPAIVIPPVRRKIGFVFQSPSLWPHMTVAQHLRFCEKSGTSGPERMRSFERTAEMMAIGRLLGRYPHELSGGERQRVAIARALITGPEILLLDEPFSNIDLSVKESILADLLAVRESCRLTVIYVTHSCEDALAVSDRIVLMREGRIEQQGEPAELYERPATIFSAGFFGETNIIEAVRSGDGVIATPLGTIGAAPGSGRQPDNADRAEDERGGQPLMIAVRPSDISICDSPEGIEATVIKSSYRGFYRQVTVRCGEKNYVIYTEKELGGGQSIFVRLSGRYTVIDNRDIREGGF
jgi:ABC-type Fe3+/spermidine/putrescine transport system ATPase subunit